MKFKNINTGVIIEPKRKDLEEAYKNNPDYEVVKEQKKPESK